MDTIFVSGGSVDQRWLFPEVSGFSATQSPIPLSQASSAPSFWQQTNLFGVIAPGWKVVNPLPIELERDEDGTYLYSDDVFAVYGDGLTPEEALQDYIESLIDFYQLLAVRTDDEVTRAQFRHLQSYVKPVGN